MPRPSPTASISPIPASAPSSSSREQFKTQTGTTLTQVPYKGGAQAVLGVMSGEVDMTLNGLLATLPHIKSGKLRALAVAGPSAPTALPDVPTLNEAALPGFQSGSWQGLLAPAGTPQDIVAKLNEAVVEVLNAPDMKQQLATRVRRSSRTRPRNSPCSSATTPPSGPRS